jgi:hypothetical protein
MCGLLSHLHKSGPGSATVSVAFVGVSPTKRPRHTKQQPLLINTPSQWSAAVSEGPAAAASNTQVLTSLRGSRSSIYEIGSSQFVRHEI